jgi:hypothetical protein
MAQRKAYTKEPIRLNNPLPRAQRYRICGDDSGHEYYIPVEQEEEFYAWVQSTENGDEDWNGREFDENRIDGTFTFTDPRCE